VKKGGKGVGGGGMVGGKRGGERGGGKGGGIRGGGGGKSGGMGFQGGQGGMNFDYSFSLWIEISVVHDSNTGMIRCRTGTGWIKIGTHMSFLAKSLF